MKIILIIFTTILPFLTSDIIYSQTRKPVWEAGFTSLVALGDQAPFWLISNRQGKFLAEKYAGAFEFGIHAKPEKGRAVDYEYGFEFFGRFGETNDGWLHTAYFGLTLYDMARIRAGKWEEIAGSSQPSITSGSVIWSGNARPMPKIEIGTPGYIALPFTGGIAEVSGMMSHGWFEEGRFVKNVWLHHKNLYFRIGGSMPVNIYYGINHYAQWGGSSPVLDNPFPSDLRSFKKVFLIGHGDPDVPGTPTEWVINRFGNHIGSRNYGIDIRFKNFSTGFYQQDIFEDNSGYSRSNFPDGLWGAYIRFPEKNRTIQAIVYEFFHSTNQSGRYHDLDGDSLGGNDNYFNHGQYRSGWTYHKYTIGTPLITSPLLNEAESILITNSRVIAHHIGFEGFIARNLRYRNLFTLSRNFGTHHRPFPRRRDQFSWMLEMSKPLNISGLEAGLTIAADIGNMHGDNFGFFFRLARNGTFGR